MTNYKGIIFDFNGTLFWDSPFHEDAWKQYSLFLRNKELSDHEIEHFVHGRTNKMILEYVLQRSVTEDEAKKYSEEKEEIYLTICEKNRNKLHLAPGAERLLNFLKQNNIPRTIATSSEKSNVDYYIDIFQLDRWFSPEQIVYNDDTFPGKPDPKIFLLAADRIGLGPQQCIVVEDSYTGIQAAHAAAIGAIWFINSNSIKSVDKIMTYADRVIHSFDEVERDLFVSRG